jgi:hypothetical protein
MQEKSAPPTPLAATATGLPTSSALAGDATVVAWGRATPLAAPPRCAAHARWRRRARETGDAQRTHARLEVDDRYRAGRRRLSWVDEGACSGQWRSRRRENCFAQRFFLAMTPNGPYSQAVIARGEEFFRRERAVNGDDVIVAGEVR